ncbi:D-serine ammonia-lyase [Acidaminobacter sp. JC074]|uniref:D-serine ammonia-lyase n=1 Tax=Acidaminobacter sp. JC074 TaxID=2530199 RepID=UPI001F0F6320|nr:D-serine ammonia-lyase [Acidaminobacter sp. JC074]MCH4888854.1 D-serine ammonia-lyase [Acidaminobacter sp. JC074]
MNKELMIEKHSILKDMMAYKPLLWQNPRYEKTDLATAELDFTISDIIDAEARLRRFQPFLEKAFDLQGIIESPLLELEGYRPVKLFMKADHALPISGSIKARGGIYEILRYAEQLLFKNNLLTIEDDYSILNTQAFQKFFSRYEIVVSSTGNLGLSIGIISASLGFKVKVHMSHDAMTWKKEKLRSIGVEVIEHTSDYSQAVIEGRRASDLKSNSYFVDDENSINLFMGYAVSALRLRDQLDKLKVLVTDDSPLFVYIPCGVGGGPGGVCYGLKEVFGDRVHVYFVEPTHSPCMLLGMATETHDEYCVQDFDIDNITIADGLAVGRASKFVGKTIDKMLAGISTVSDDTLYKYLKDMVDRYQIKQEPSALAGFQGLDDILNADPVHGHMTITKEQVQNGTHIVWSTGGNMVPEDIMTKYYRNAQEV